MCIVCNPIHALGRFHHVRVGYLSIWPSADICLRHVSNTRGHVLVLSTSVGQCTQYKCLDVHEIISIY